jgi:hypothetical protein
MLSLNDVVLHGERVAMRLSSTVWCIVVCGGGVQIFGATERDANDLRIVGLYDVDMDKLDAMAVRTRPTLVPPPCIPLNDRITPRWHPLLILPLRPTLCIPAHHVTAHLSFIRRKCARYREYPLSIPLSIVVKAALLDLHSFTVLNQVTPHHTTPHHVKR